MNNVQRKRGKMKKVIIDSLKSYKWKILIQVTLITLNIYLLTIPAKIIGKIVDLLYDIPNNKQVILNKIILKTKPIRTH